MHGIGVVVKEEGLIGIYRGLAPTIAKQMGNQSIRFSVYSELKKVGGHLLPPPPPHPPFLPLSLSPFLSLSLSSFLSALLHLAQPLLGLHCPQVLNGGDPKKEVAGWKMMGAGFTAGAVSVFLTMPFDVVKTRMQVWV